MSITTRASLARGQMSVTVSEHGLDRAKRRSASRISLKGYVPSFVGSGTEGSQVPYYLSAVKDKGSIGRDKGGAFRYVNG